MSDEADQRADDSDRPGNAPSGLRIRALTHAYSVDFALQDIDLQVSSGEVHCLVGPSGSGKSTLLRLVAGLERVQIGQIFIGGHLLSDGERGLDTPPEKRPVGMVFQDYALFPHLGVLDNVGFALRGARDAKRARALELLELVDLRHKADAMPHTLSGGEQQRVALARALAREPLVMLLDEPFSGLDARLRESVRSTTLGVLRRADVATLVVTHDPEEALSLGDQISVIRAGRIVQTGPPSSIYRKSRNLAVAETFGPVNRIAAQRREGGLETPLGTLSADAPGTELAKSGSLVEVLVRPEFVELLDDDGQATDTATQSLNFRAEISNVAVRGAQVHCTLEAPGGLHLDAFTLRRFDIRAGASVAVRISSEDVMVVPLADSDH